jgi:hypothetical protein
MLPDLSEPRLKLMREALDLIEALLRLPDAEALDRMDEFSDRSALHAFVFEEMTRLMNDLCRRPTLSAAVH